MESKVTANTFCTYTNGPGEAEATIFFVSGNPGLIGYYHPFLSLLARYLGQDTVDSKAAYQIYGCSLGGFEVDDGHGETSPASSSTSGTRRQTGMNGSEGRGPRLYDLDDQIRFVQGKLAALMDDNENVPAAHELTRRRKVILVGHSVGAYIAMEVLRRHRENGNSQSADQSSKPSSAEFDIVGGVMLFPTVVDIALSPSGQKLTTLLSLIPQLALVVSVLSRLLTTLLPASTLRSLIRSFMENPPTHALETTYTFLTSANGVRQALHMATDEMRTITTDEWSDDIWGVARAHEPLTKMFFYFGRNDHWVAEKTRDEIIALRDGSGPRMVVCEEGLPHAFCLKHSDITARKVAAMVREIGS